METRLIKILTTVLLVVIVAGTSLTASAQGRATRSKTTRTERIRKPVRRTEPKAPTSTSISATEWEPNKTTLISFLEFPSTIDEWKQMQKTFGLKPEGAVALQVMAFELYRNNRTDGEQALKLNNTSTNYNSTVERLREIMGKDQYYARPYIAWALLEGATPENGYNVLPPYSLRIKVDPNKKYQESQLLHGTVISLLIDSKGWDTNWRGVEVVRPAGSDYFVVSNCPAMYTQCKEAKKQ